MLSCLAGHIGLYGCTTSSNSGLFVNDLAGINLKMVDKVADSDYASFTQAWTKIETRALNRFYTDIVSYLAKQYRLKTATHNINMGRKLGSTTTAGSSQYRGVLIELSEEGNDYAASNLRQIYVQSFDLYSTGSATVTYKVFDQDLDTELATGTASVTSGWNTVSIYQSFSARRISIVIDASTFTTTELNTVDIREATSGYSYDSYILRVQGVTSTVADPYTLTTGNNAHGLSVKFYVKCSFENFICDNRDIFTNSLLYLLGVELLTEAINSDRFNEYTLFNEEKAEELRTQYYMMYMGGTFNDMNYNGELPRVMDGLRLNEYDMCLECNSELRYIETLP